MPLLALLQISEKSWMKEILFFFLTHKYQVSNTAEHVVFLLKLEYCFMHGLSNELSKFSLSSRKHVPINSYNSYLSPVKFGQGSCLSLLLFFSLDLNQALKLCKVNHFADIKSL